MDMQAICGTYRKGRTDEQPDDNFIMINIIHT